MKNSIPLSLHIPEPKYRPGDTPDFSDMVLSEAGAVARPEITATPRDMSDLAYQLIRVLAPDGSAIGPWNPRLDADVLREGLRCMLVTRRWTIGSTAPNARARPHST